MFKLNEETTVSVRTPVGDTKTCDIKEIVAQGTNESGIVSSANLSGGVMEYFSDSKYEVDYDGVDLAPCMYVDDIARLAETLEAVRDGNRRLEAMAESKLLTFHDNKSGMILIGSKKFRKKRRKNLLKTSNI